jgi:hypothetical protein
MPWVWLLHRKLVSYSEMGHSLSECRQWRAHLAQVGCSCSWDTLTQRISKVDPSLAWIGPWSQKSSPFLHVYVLGLWGIMSLKLYPSQHIRHWNSEALNSLITPLSTTTQSPLRTIGPYDTGAGDPEWPVELMQGRAIGVDRCFTLSLRISTFDYIHIEIW